MWTSVDRWSCPHPGCNRTVVIDASDEDTAAALTAVQWRHFREHRAAAEVEQRMRADERLMSRGSK